MCVLIFDIRYWAARDVNACVEDNCSLSFRFLASSFAGRQGGLHSYSAPERHWRNCGRPGYTFSKADDRLETFQPQRYAYHQMHKTLENINFRVPVK